MGNEQQKRPPPPPQDPSDKIFDTMFEFKMMSKSMAKESTKAESQSKALVKKVKDCIAKGDYEHAKLAASDAIRQKNMVKRYRALSSKIDTVGQRLQELIKIKDLLNKCKALLINYLVQEMRWI